VANLIAGAKKYGLMLLGGIAALFAVLFYRERAGREQDRRELSEGARDVEREATNAVVDGQRREQEIRNAPIDTRARDRFER
jgi:hypothetical protein